MSLGGAGMVCRRVAEPGTFHYVSCMRTSEQSFKPSRSAWSCGEPGFSRRTGEVMGAIRKFSRDLLASFRPFGCVLILLAGAVVAVNGPAAQVNLLPADQKLARDIFRELIEINTTPQNGSTKAAEAMAARLKSAGFASPDLQLLGPRPDRQNLVGIIRGNGRRQPLLFIGHLDVVEARREDWSFDPFKFIERDGYYYGRGTSDMKGADAVLVTTFIRLKNEGFVPDRDLILALTADEEIESDANGVAWLLAHHRPLIAAEFCINPDGGGGEIRKGRHAAMELETSEKAYHSVQLEVKNPGGHSSLPVKENAIYRLAKALLRLQQFEFPIKLNETTRLFFEHSATLESGDTRYDILAMLKNPGDSPAAKRLAAGSAYYNAMMRTTIVPTMLNAGHAENALPQSARAILNSRILPGDSPESVEATLKHVLADDRISITALDKPVVTPPSPLRPDVLRALEGVTAALWPGVIVTPTMAPGASDGRFLREAGIPAYGISGLFTDIDDVRAHGKDERVGVQEFEEDVEFTYRFTKAVSSNGPR